MWTHDGFLDRPPFSSDGETISAAIQPATESRRGCWGRSPPTEAGDSLASSTLIRIIATQGFTHKEDITSATRRQRSVA